MRAMSAARIKASAAGKQKTYKNRPTSGTKIGNIYDMFMSQRGLVIEWKAQDHGESLIIDVLRYIYGLDIRLIRKGRNERKSQWLLAGEWDGKVYIDYVAERQGED